MANLGFLGLGLMGYPMARNLLRAGHSVALWSNNAEKARKLAADEKGKFCTTPRKWAKTRMSSSFASATPTWLATRSWAQTASFRE